MQFCLTAEMNIQLTTGMSQRTSFLEINFDRNSFSFATDALNLSLPALKSMRQQLTISHIFSISLILVSIYELLNEVKNRIDHTFRIYKSLGRVQPPLILFRSPC